MWTIPKLLFWSERGLPGKHERCYYLSWFLWVCTDYYRTEVKRWNVGMRITSRTPKQRIRVWAEWQVVALFLSGRFMWRYLSSLAVQSVFIVAPHWLLQIVACCCVPSWCICCQSKGWTEDPRGIRSKTPVLRNTLFLSKSVNGNIALCTMELLWYCCHRPPAAARMEYRWLSSL